MALKKSRVMTFWDHVEEFRKRLIIASLFVIGGTVVGYIVFPLFVSLMQQTIGEKLFTFEIAEGFMVRLKIALALGLFLSLPFVFFEIVLFVIPALKPREKRILFVVLISSFILFLGGVVFAFKGVLPLSIEFLKSPEFNPENVGRQIRFEQFFDFYMVFLLCFGLCFQFPVVMLLVLQFKIVPLRFFTKNFKFFLIIIFVIAAVITPPDVISCLMMAAPMVALYGLTLLIAKVIGFGKKNRQGKAA